MKIDKEEHLTFGYGRKFSLFTIIAVIGGYATWITFYKLCRSGSCVAFRIKFESELNENSSHLNKTDRVIYNNCSRYVSFGEFGGKGLGNQMFIFAAALYVSELSGREVVLFGNYNTKTLGAAFDLNVKRLSDVCPKYNFKEALISYDVRLDKLLLNNSEILNKAIVLLGYFQSWNYVKSIQDHIRRSFNFKNVTRKFARNFLDANVPPGWTTGFMRVGVHNRRGNFLHPIHLRGGFSVATEAYFQKAMDYFVKRYGTVQFIVVTLDIAWSKKFIYFKSDREMTNVTFSVGHTAIHDMAILSMCDHVIVSTGSFGWWSAWLAGGTTIYYSDYPRRNSSFSRSLNREDYYPPSWIPME